MIVVYGTLAVVAMRAQQGHLQDSAANLLRSTIGGRLRPLVDLSDALGWHGPGDDATVGGPLPGGGSITVALSTDQAAPLQIDLRGLRTGLGIVGKRAGDPSFGGVCGDPDLDALVGLHGSKEQLLCLPAATRDAIWQAATHFPDLYLASGHLAVSGRLPETPELIEQVKGLVALAAALRDLPVGPEALEHQVREDPLISVRLAAFAHLRATRREAARNLARDLLGAGPPELRLEAALLLQHADTLLGLVKEESAPVAVRVRAMQALQGPANPEALFEGPTGPVATAGDDAARAAAASGEGPLQQAALVRLKGRGGAEVLAGIVASLPDPPGPPWDRAGLSLLLECLEADPDPRIEGLLWPLCSATDGQVQRRALELLATRGTHASLPTLQPLTGGLPGARRAAARQAVAAIEARDDGAHVGRLTLTEGAQAGALSEAEVGGALSEVETPEG